MGAKNFSKIWLNFKEFFLKQLFRMAFLMYNIKIILGKYVLPTV